LDTGNAAAFRAEAGKSAEGRATLTSIKLYIEGLSYVSSMGIGSMVEWMIELRKKRVALYFVNTPAQIKSVMDLLGFTNFLNLTTEKRD
jgi:anti-anti-sigma factor